MRGNNPLQSETPDVAGWGGGLLAHSNQGILTDEDARMVFRPF